MTTPKGQKDGSIQKQTRNTTPVSKPKRLSEASPAISSGNVTPSSSKSPAAAPPVLTGPRRVLNDTIVSLHSSVQIWKKLLLQGLELMQGVQSHRENDDTVRRHCEQLGVIIRQMKAQVTKIGQFSEQLSNLALLNTTSSPPFLTWNYEDFCEAAKEIHTSYEMETKVRMELAYNLHKCPHEQLNFCIIAWTHLVYVDEFKFEAMLIECALRKE